MSYEIAPKRAPDEGCEGLIKVVKDYFKISDNVRYDDLIEEVKNKNLNIEYEGST